MFIVLAVFKSFKQNMLSNELVYLKLIVEKI